MNTYNYFKYINSIYISEKTRNLEKSDIFVIKVNKKINKKDIKKTIYNIFKIKVKKINTLITKRKKKIYKNVVGYSKSWKKVYITLEKGKYKQYLDKIENVNI